MNVVIITAKGNNTSLTNKNMLQVGGQPVLYYVIQAAKRAEKVNKIYLSTEDEGMKRFAQENGIDLIDRPQHLSQPESLHKDVIEHAVRQVQSVHPDLQNCMVLLGNTVMISKELIDTAFTMLEEGDCDSVLSGWRAQDDHPYRALTLDDEGYLKSFLGVSAGSNRQSYPQVFFYDQGVWAFKWQCAIEQRGMSPWVWMGTKCRLIERMWVTGRDIHTWIDVSASQWYLSGIQPAGLDSFEIVKPKTNE